MDLTIKSFEGHIYFAEVDGNILADAHHQPVRFDSINDIKEYFRGHSLNSVQLQQLTPYDEMCGMSGSTEPLSIPLKW
ncbi:DUF6482 family protein [Thalassotalea maritima]|uniref:DUF6482 family protein n=1 Tax=Thalassotalea maritima TaxID=3242416 RepID=UPI0035294530